MAQYDDIEVTEHDSAVTWYYVVLLGDSTPYRWTSAPSTQSATIEDEAGAENYYHPRGGISHTEPTEGADSAGTGLELHVSPDNPVVIKHRSYPPQGSASVTIYRQNETGGDLRHFWTGRITEINISEEGEGESFTRSGLIICETEQEQIAGQEGLVDNFGPTCPRMLGTFPCPVPLASITDTATVVSVTPASFQVRLTPTETRDAGWYKAGVLIAPDDDKRHVADDTVTGADHILVLNQNFPATTLKASDTCQVIWGCDRQRGTCAVKFGLWTGDGNAFQGNPIQTNKDLHRIGRLQ